MNKYQDKWGRYHQKECLNGEPSGNNGWIYTAYSQKVGLPFDIDVVGHCFNLCRLDSETLVRNPGDIVGKNVPVSRDEILGMISLGILNPTRISWNFSPYPIPSFSLVKLIKQLLEARGKHRNYFWQNNLDQVYRFAFSVPLQDRAFILRKWKKFQWFNPIHLFYAVLGRVCSLYKPNGLDWLKYGGKVAEMEMIKEFPEDHPITLKVLK